MNFLPRNTGQMALFFTVALEAIEQRRAMQKPAELAALLSILAPRGVRHVLEVGSMHGGTAWAWSQIASGKVVCVDNHTLEGRGEFAPEDAVLITGDSRWDSTVACACAVTDGEPFDFIFIDGDHTYAAVWGDANTWMPTLADDGIIAFHDVCHRKLPGFDMWRFWQEIREDHTNAYVIYDGSQPWGGIGVLAKEILAELPLYTRQAEFLSPPPQCVERCGECDGALDLFEEILCRGCAGARSAALAQDQMAP